MDIYNHTEYMKAIATNLKDIGHSSNHKAFAIASTINLFEGLNENLNSIHLPALVVIDDLSSRLTDNDSDNLLDIPFYQFVIIHKAKVNDAASQQEGRRMAKAIAKKVLSRMFLDKRKSINGLTNIDRNNIMFDTVGPVGDGACGCLVSFSITEEAKIVYTKEDWIDG